MEILVDLHTHTIASGHAYSTVTENALAAARKGLKLLGITDHAPSMPDAPHLNYFSNLSILPAKLSGVRILPGIEANIINHEGELDVPRRIFVKMHLVLAGLHTLCYPGGTCEQNTAAFLKAMENPFVDMMVHPDRAECELDLERIAQASANFGVPVEINNKSLVSERTGAWDNCRLLAKYMARYGGPVILGSDAHFWNQIGEFDHALEVVAETGVPWSQILNTSPSRVMSYLYLRRKSQSTANSVVDCQNI